VFIAPEADVPNFNLRPFADNKRDTDGSGRDGADFGANGGELTSVLGEQLFQRDLGLLDLRGIVLVLDRESDLAFLETVENVAGGNCIQAGVVDLTDGGALFDIDVEDPTFGVLLALETDVLEVARVPERVEVAFDGRRVVDVATFSEDAGLDRLGRNAAVAVNADIDDQVLLADSRDSQEQKGEQTEDAIPDRPALPNSCGERTWRPKRLTLRARVAERQGARGDSMMTAMNRNYLEKLELGKR